jgi:hypothetical protein
MVESICGQGFAYTHEVEEDRQKKLVKLELQTPEDTEPAAEKLFVTATNVLAIYLWAIRVLEKKARLPARCTPSPGIDPIDVELFARHAWAKAQPAEYCQPSKNASASMINRGIDLIDARPPRSLRSGAAGPAGPWATVSNRRMGRGAARSAGPAGPTVPPLFFFCLFFIY